MTNKTKAYSAAEDDVFQAELYVLDGKSELHAKDEEGRALFWPAIQALRLLQKELRKRGEWS